LQLPTWLDVPHVVGGFTRSSSRLICDALARYRKDRLELDGIQLKALIARLLAFAGVVSTFVWFFWFQQTSLGYIAETKDGVTSVSAGTTPRVIAISLVGLTLYCVLVNTKANVIELHSAPMWRRTAAFAMDFWFALFTLSALFGLVPLLFEAVRTGVFRWHFQRDHWTPTDGADVALVLVFLATFVAYFLLPLMRRGQTVGCWVFRLATVNADGYVVYVPFSTAIRRLLAEFRGVCSPFKTFRTLDGDGQTFYDRESGFTVVRC